MILFRVIGLHQTTRREECRVAADRDDPLSIDKFTCVGDFAPTLYEPCYDGNILEETCLTSFVDIVEGLKILFPSY